MSIADKGRKRIKHVFAGLAQLGGKTVRIIGLTWATLQLNWQVAAYNLRHLVYLKEGRIESLTPEVHPAYQFGR